jgi:hypothetical protein
MAGPSGCLRISYGACDRLALVLLPCHFASFCVDLSIRLAPALG